MSLDAFSQFKTILEVLDAVGGVHLQGKILRPNEQFTFDRVVKLLNEAGDLEEAEAISQMFPFEDVAKEFGPEE